MKTKKEFLALLDNTKDKFGFNPAEITQEHDEWLHLKLGVLSASRIIEAVKRLKNGKYSQSRETYLLDLVSQVLTREMPEISGKALEHGKNNEAGARAHFELSTGKRVEELPFVFKKIDDAEIEDNEFRLGVSPDGIVEDDNAVVEIKCPHNSNNHTDFLISTKIKPEYLLQMQLQMYVMGADKAYFVSYDPRNEFMPMAYTEILPCEDTYAIFDQEIPIFLKQMDEMLELVGVQFGWQW